MNCKYKSSTALLLSNLYYRSDFVARRLVLSVND
ncbi:hypothetical protein X975_06280, partial [Stegodyphus mimosarum]